jgi:hypothetical protein
MVQPGDRNSADSLFMRAMSLKQAGQLPEAIEVMEQLCNSFPNEWDPQNHLALMCAIQIYSNHLVDSCEPLRCTPPPPYQVHCRWPPLGSAARMEPVIHKSPEAA